MHREIAIARCKARWFAGAGICLALASALALGTSAAGARSPLQARAHISEWSPPELGAYPGQIVAGSDDSAWFTNNVSRGNVNSGTLVHYAQVDRIDGSGNITPFSVGEDFLTDVARGPAGISFVGAGRVGQIIPGGQVQEFPVRTGTDFLSIASGAGGYLWLTKHTETGHDAIQRISGNGVVKAFPLGRYAWPTHITRGADGAMWFTEYGSERIGRITSTGKITEFPLTVRAYGEAQPVTPVGEIVAGAHGYIWFGTFEGFGRLNPASGKLTLFRRREAGEALAAGPDGSIWFSEYGKVVQITPSGNIGRIIRLPRLERVTALAVGSDGIIWYTAKPRTTSGVVGRITFAGSA